MVLKMRKRKKRKRKTKRSVIELILVLTLTLALVLGREDECVQIDMLRSQEEEGKIRAAAMWSMCANLF